MGKTSPILQGYELWLEDMKLKNPSRYKRMKHFLAEFDHHFWLRPRT